MNKWELARYILDAKKSIDSVLYISNHIEELSMIDLRSEVNEIKRKFYVNGCVVLDKCFPKNKKEICEEEIIKSIYYERDKNYAHKDDDYKMREYVTMDEISDEMKTQLQCIVDTCIDFLPVELTLDYVAFDSKLFRIVNGITKEKEDEILNYKHLNRGKQFVVPNEYTRTFKVFNDTEDIRNISSNEKSQYATILSVGICIEETMQHLQDGVVKCNVLYGLNMWVSINQSKLNEIKKLRELGMLDNCDIPYIPKNKKDEKRVIQLLKKEGLMNE